MPENPPKLFAYGSLKPGELGFEQIEHLVSSHSPGELKGYALFLRDGLPLIGKSASDESIEGVVLNINLETEEEFWKVVSEYEGTTNYNRHDTLQAFIGDKEVPVSAFIGRKMGKGNPERLYSPWTSKLDPIFSQSFPLLHNTIASNNLLFKDAEGDTYGYWNQLNNLLSQYLLLVSILEHLTVVKFGGSKKQEAMMRIRKLQISKGFPGAFNAMSQEKYNPPFKVSDSRAVEDTLSSTQQDQALFAWYQVRSNLQHRGKSSLFDAKLVQKSCVGLSNFLLEFFRANIQGIESEWAAITGSTLLKTELVSSF